MDVSRKILQAVFITSAIAILALSCGTKKEADAGEKKEAVPVITAIPEAAGHNEILLSGSVVSLQTANISTRIMGTITRLYVKQGDVVHKGQLLASVSSQDLQSRRAQVNAAITEAEANLQNAQKDFDRYSNLYRKQSATAKELDNVTLQYNAAKSRVESANQLRNEVNAMLSYSSLTAPFDGVVTQRMADEGTMASPGMTLFTIEQNGKLQVNGTVSESVISKIRKNDNATLEIRAAGKTIESVVTDIVPSAQGGQYMVKFNIPDNQRKDLYAGMYVNITMKNKTGTSVDGNTDVVLVPTASLVQNDQLTGLYTISSRNTALLRWVRTGKIYADKTEILSGLGAGEKYILSAEGRLYDGTPVTEKTK